MYCLDWTLKIPTRKLRQRKNVVLFDEHVSKYSKEARPDGTTFCFKILFRSIHSFLVKILVQHYINPKPLNPQHDKVNKYQTAEHQNKITTHYQYYTENSQMAPLASSSTAQQSIAPSGRLQVITLEASDNSIHKHPEDVVSLCGLIRDVLVDLPEESRNSPIPVMCVTGPVLIKVMEWCHYHKDDPICEKAEHKKPKAKDSTDIGQWDQNFMRVDWDMMFDIIMAANYLDIKPLLDIGCKTVANIFKEKSPEEIRRLCHIENDFTKEEEEQIQKENQWAAYS
jgi:S-phase kinase-associated protein 1